MFGSVTDDPGVARPVFTSLADNIQESFGLTPVEAMACGLPVVATDVVQFFLMFLAFLVLVFLLFFGVYFIGFLQLTEHSIRIAGGIILFLIALKMVFPVKRSAWASDELQGEPLLVPLAIPMVAGPSAMAVVMGRYILKVVPFPGSL
mgnify:CR=1 FL=1